MAENTSTTPETTPEPPAVPAWSLGGEPPEPQKVEIPTTETDPAKIAAAAAKGAKVNAAASHTGTDPLGRAVGPKENHKEIKKVRHPETGKVVTPNRDGTLPDPKGKR